MFSALRHKVAHAQTLESARRVQQAVLAQLAHRRDRLLDRGAAPPRFHRDKSCHRLIVPGDDDLLALTDPVEQFGEFILGLEGPDDGRGGRHKHTFDYSPIQLADSQFKADGIMAQALNSFRMKIKMMRIGKNCALRKGPKSA